MRGDPDHDWADEEAGPVVRPYAVTGGRVRPATEGFDLVAFVQASDHAPGPDQHLHPEHLAIIAIAQESISVAEVAARLNLPLGVVRVLLGDLLQAGLVEIHEPAAAQFPDDNLLKAVVNGLRAL
ncbi:MAG TPA: DUF742 domain-containing protein [Micromonosporaceae bacterium]